MTDGYTVKGDREMKHIQSKGYDGYEAQCWLLGETDYYIYNPYAEALRLYADYLENRGWEVRDIEKGG